MPFALLALGVALVLGGILLLRLHAFIALMAAALVVSVLSPGDPEQVVERVVVAFGAAAGKLGPVVVFAAVVGAAMTRSGAASRVVVAMCRLVGAKRPAWALMGSGFVLSVPVFFDTVFYLLLPLARAQAKQPHGRYLYGLLAIVAGAGVTHTLVPPTPGPLAMAAALDVDVGTMMLVGACVGLPAAWVAMLVAHRLDLRLSSSLELVGLSASEPEESKEASRSLGLVAAISPIVAPVLLIGWGTMDSAGKGQAARPAWQVALTSPAVAVGLAMLLALFFTWQVLGSSASSDGEGRSASHRAPAGRREELAQLIQQAVQDSGVIVLITAAGAAFGASLQAAGVGEAIQSAFGSSSAGLGLLALGFGLAAVLKLAQGSSTAAMVVGSSMLAAMVQPAQLAFHPVYLCTAVGGGSLVGSWMNDSGFWLFSTMGRLSERQTLGTWSVLLAVLGFTAFATSVLFAILLPLR